MHTDQLQTDACTEDRAAAPHEVPTRVVCIGDLHGNLAEVIVLWSNLEAAFVGPGGLRGATVIFLGDYCDRGPNTAGVLDWLIALRDSRAADPLAGPTHFLAGNHDFAMAAFLGALPTDTPPPASTLENEVAAAVAAAADQGYPSPLFEPATAGGMHFQGRRWGGSDLYNAAETYASYGAGPMDTTAEARDRLLARVPSSHIEFLRGLVWVHDQPTAFPPGRVVCAHAGLDVGRPAELQIAALRSRNVCNPSVLHPHRPGRIVAFSERNMCVEMHPDLVDAAVLVSGHHGFTDVQGDRIIIDSSGGNPSTSRPIHAVVLPDRKLVASVPGAPVTDI